MILVFAVIALAALAFWLQFIKLAREAQEAERRYRDEYMGTGPLYGSPDVHPAPLGTRPLGTRMSDYGDDGRLNSNDLAWWRDD